MEDREVLVVFTDRYDLNKGPHSTRVRVRRGDSIRSTVEIAFRQIGKAKFASDDPPIVRVIINLKNYAANHAVPATDKINVTTDLK